ncbi:MAG: hypothetical protein GY714_11890 [Desulfobacterales bacterium]|nr:hypothetical protein [Desulfobacterales bacterium]
MGKKLVRANCVDEYICIETGSIYVDGSIILAPGAKDLLRNKGIRIVYGPKPNAQKSEICSTSDASKIDQLVVQIVKILKNDFCITDTEKVVRICSQVIKLINNN